MRGRAVGHWPTMRMHKAVGANGGGKIVPRKSGAAVLGILWGNLVGAQPRAR